ncbi:MAG: orotate phosphoribosyltransferase [Candidatus Gracilibacteria bacterium]|jgi:orotate phosphoribosyltransferase
MDYAKLVAEALLQKGAFKISLSPLFTWASGIKSPVYCDLRALISDVSVRESVVEAFKAMKSDWSQVDCIAGTATAGIPWAAWLAEAVKKPMVYVRGEAKDHGTKRRIEGALTAGARVVLIEDHVSTGGSSVSAVTALRVEGGAVCDEILAINSYQLAKADAQFAEAKVKVTTITDYPTILTVAREKGTITEENEALLSDFRADPAVWAEKHGLN